MIDDDDDDDDDDGWGRRRDRGVILSNPPLVSRLVYVGRRPNVGIVSVLALAFALSDRLTPLQQSVRGFLLAFDVPTLLFVCLFRFACLIFSR